MDHPWWAWPIAEAPEPPKPKPRPERRSLATLGDVPVRLASKSKCEAAWAAPRLVDRRCLASSPSSVASASDTARLIASYCTVAAGVSDISPYSLGRIASG